MKKGYTSTSMYLCSKLLSSINAVMGIVKKCVRNYLHFELRTSNSHQR